MTDIIPEIGYDRTMMEKVLPYIEKRKHEFWFDSDENVKIHACFYECSDPKATIIISHGFTEAAAKFAEVVYMFLKQGYNVWLPEHAGHGFSTRFRKDLRQIDIDAFDRYANDFNMVASHIKFQDPFRPLFIYAHSMGCAIAALAASWAPHLYEAIVLSAPMIEPLTGFIHYPTAKAVTRTLCRLGFKDRLLPTQKDLEQETFETSGATSKARYDWYYSLRMQEPELQTFAATFNWMNEVAKARDKIFDEAVYKIHVPVLVFEAEDETYVSNKALERFVKKLSENTAVQFVRMFDSRHEIYMSSTQTLDFYYRRIFQFYNRCLKTDR